MAKSTDGLSLRRSWMIIMDPCTITLNGMERNIPQIRPLGLIYIQQDVFQELQCLTVYTLCALAQHHPFKRT